MAHFLYVLLNQGIDLFAVNHDAEIQVMVQTGYGDVILHRQHAHNPCATTVFGKHGNALLNSVPWPVDVQLLPLIENFTLAMAAYAE